MSTTKQIILILALSVLSLVTGLLLSFPQKFGICGAEAWSCISHTSSWFGTPLTLWSIFLIPSIALILIFRNSVYSIWKKFALIYIPLSIIAIVFTPVTCGGFFPSCLQKEQASWLTAIGFLIITVGLILYQKLRKPQTTQI